MCGLDWDIIIYAVYSVTTWNCIFYILLEDGAARTHTGDVDDANGEDIDDDDDNFGGAFGWAGFDCGRFWWCN